MKILPHVLMKSLQSNFQLFFLSQFSIPVASFALPAVFPACDSAVLTDTTLQYHRQNTRGMVPLQYTLLPKADRMPVPPCCGSQTDFLPINGLTVIFPLWKSYRQQSHFLYIHIFFHKGALSRPPADQS